MCVLKDQYELNLTAQKTSCNTRKLSQHTLSFINPQKSLKIKPSSLSASKRITKENRGVTRARILDANYFYDIDWGLNSVDEICRHFGSHLGFRHPACWVLIKNRLWYLRGRLLSWVCLGLFCKGSKEFRKICLNANISSSAGFWEFEILPNFFSFFSETKLICNNTNTYNMYVYSS